jgi:hypothetical protein
MEDAASREAAGKSQLRSFIQIPSESGDDRELFIRNDFQVFCFSVPAPDQLLEGSCDSGSGLSATFAFAGRIHS